MILADGYSDMSSNWQIFSVVLIVIIEAVSSSDNGCIGLLPSPCSCTPPNASTTISCLDAQFNDADLDYLVVVGSGHLHTLRSVTFAGNQFTHLPDYAFGIYVENVQGLEYLNLSSNRIATIFKESFCGMENLETLDLSNNNINLKSDNVANLSIFIPVAKSLKYLKLKSFFDGTSDVTSQVQRLKKSFEIARFRRLHFLDLSSNDLDFLPYDFLCNLPDLRNFYLSGNSLTTLFLNPRCYSNLKTLDLSKNRFVRLDAEFKLTAQSLRADYSINLLQNPFECNCNSTDYIEWMEKNLAKIHNVEALRCFKASPKEFAGKSIIGWVIFNLNNLDCGAPVTESSGSIHSSLPYSVTRFLIILANLYLFSYSLLH